MSTRIWNLSTFLINAHEKVSWIWCCKFSFTIILIMKTDIQTITVIIIIIIVFSKRGCTPATAISGAWDELVLAGGPTSKNAEVDVSRTRGSNYLLPITCCVPATGGSLHGLRQGVGQRLAWGVKASSFGRGKAARTFWMSWRVKNWESQMYTPMNKKEKKKKEWHEDKEHNFGKCDYGSLLEDVKECLAVDLMKHINQAIPLKTDSGT